MKYTIQLHTLVNELIDDIKQRNEDECPLVHFISNPEIYALFEKSIKLDELALFHEYQIMAHKQFQSGIPYSDYTHFIHLFSTELLNKTAIILDDTVLISKINTIKNIVINATAKGYLLELLPQDIPTINTQLNEYVAIDYINSHLHWMKRMVFDIENDVKNATIELNPKKCTFGLWLATNEIETYFSPSEVKEIHTIHNTIHHSATSLYKHLKNQYYHQLLLDYLFLSRTSFSLVSRMNTKVTHQFLSEQVETDALTQLKNRHSLDLTLVTLFEDLHEKNHIFSIALLDIDFFKKVNDTFGHQVGDVVLVNLATILKENIRYSDSIYRYGGEEFLIIFQHCSLDIAQKLCEKLRQTIANHTFEGVPEGYQVTASFGLSQPSKMSDTPKELIEVADTNLYKAKEQGRNCIVF